MKHLYVAAELIQAAGLAEIGVDLFVGTMPHDTQTGVMLRDPLVGAMIDDGMQDFFDHEFQVVVRNTDPGVGYEQARAIGEILTMSRRDFPGIHIVRMNPRTLPVSYPMGDADHVETSVRIHCAFGLLAS
jgi:hypothetical protein